MKPLYFLLLICTYLCLIFNDRVDAIRGKRKPTAVDDDIYECLLKIVKGDSLPPVKDRTKAQRSAVVRYWRAKGQISIHKDDGKECLCIKGRRMVRKSEMSEIIAEEVKRTKGSGARKLINNLKHSYVGLGRKKVQDILNCDKQHHRKNAKFSNKATLKPIRARDVQVRHQVDLMDMGAKETVSYDNQLYRYVGNRRV